jgi:LemA protein
MHSLPIIGGCLAIFAMWMWEVDGRWIAAFSAALVAYAFNSMVHMHTTAQNAFATIEVMLKKRYDLIPGLIDAVQRYIEHEGGLLEEVTRLRSRALASGVGAAEAAAIDQRMSSVLPQVMATAEAYPELKSSHNFMQLQRSLNEVEEQISAARRSFNMSVKHYNDAVRMLPTNLFALVLRYEQMPYFDMPDEQGEPHDVMARFRRHQAS